MTIPISDREALARIIDEGAWCEFGFHTPGPTARRGAALAKADQWLARSSGGGSKNANEAQRLLTLIRSGGLDPRPAAVALGLPFDQDIITGILELAALARSSGGGETLQARVQPWMMACFGPEIAADRLERNDRFIEEALELVQASGYEKSRAHELVEYVYGRPQGDINQEVGGVMITLAAHCLAHGVDMHEAGETELARIWTKVEQIREKQKTKPKGSALPIAALPSPAPSGVGETELQKAASKAGWTAAAEPISPRPWMGLNVAAPAPLPSGVVELKEAAEAVAVVLQRQQAHARDINREYPTQAHWEPSNYLITRLRAAIAAVPMGGRHGG